MRKPKVMPRNPVPASEPTTAQTVAELLRSSQEMEDAIRTLREVIDTVETAVVR